MKPVTHQTDVELRYNISDCMTAIAAMPAGYNVERYLSELRACEAEQQARSAKRTWRGMLHGVFDPLDRPAFQASALLTSGARFYRARTNPSSYHVSQWRSAAYRLAWIRLYGV